ncbi:von Willebrand factor type A domain-containing protein [Candidatus Palauibacter soopunensis]|uniref:YfbK domain-containing protein n=1 Tax=Candidatus Palauibacter soopunensis TaxID=3056739 RepID=UPI0023A3DC3D|nr:von Willebrand factor type A domain-containing protein [Candidatus Palauibacter soopunensis]MDE2877701.1 von Willebrand factor type A domain-containing protein [Candidatus Palauibacter soopunensis]
MNVHRIPVRIGTLLALIFAIAGPARSYAQSETRPETGTVQGTVLDATANVGVAGAQVFVAGTVIGTLTDAEGGYSLSGVPTGEQVVTVRLIGYRESSKTVSVTAGRTLTLDFTVEQTALRLQDLTATGVAGETPQDRHPYAVERTARGLATTSAMRAYPGYNTESYARIVENDFRSVGESPLSTFSIDVDRASYANVRRFIQAGERPPVDAVRIEEMINYFPYEWDGAAGDHPFQVVTEVWDAPWKPEHRLVRIGLEAPSVDTENLPPSNLVFLLDVSGSMSSPDKLPLLKKAFALLTEQLRPQDRVAIVVYAGAAGLVLPPTPGNRRARILSAVERLEAGGSTAGGAGIALAYKVARKHFVEDGNNRVILATDGDFNVGASSDEAMVRLIERERESGIFLTVLGFGTGNLKDSKMEQIADRGNGNFHYVDGLLEARKVLVEEMGGTLFTVAKDVKLQVEFNPARAAAHRLIGYENRLLADEDFNDDTKDAGELGAGHTVTALYEVVPAGLPVPRSVDPLRYQPAAEPTPPVEAPPGAFEDELLYVKVRYKDPDGAESKLLAHAVADRSRSPSRGFRFAAAVAGFGMLLRDSPHAGGLSADDVISLAEGGRGDDPRGYRGEFIRLVETVRDLDLLGTAAEDGDQR